MSEALIQKLIYLLKSHLPLFDFDAFIFTETWLYNNNNNSSELGFHNFSTFRCDKSSLTSSFSRGGGVLISISDKYVSSKFDIIINSLELCFVLIKFNSSKKLIIDSVYFSPSSNSNLYIEYFNVVENLIASFPNTD